ncbi:hypothetical protein [Salisediminibacterium beveridgei]|uniref:DUF8042 domain-containing protein n=1 Tax=Salisediminibacterium beveridgei TaxID=632773 RepID=A0A1D7QSD7_9BACI|nr:hypothetical protein [Salisediminibacterium beveridgei]AOM81913.1 hypothetical protein BBEV_0520 [Salisediminibacterium beveridgei]
MEKYIEVMKQSLNVLETMIEGLEHIPQQIQENKTPDAIQLMDDMMVGFMSVEKSLTPVLEEAEGADIATQQLQKVNETFERVVTAMENDAFDTVAAILEQALTPQVKKLHATLTELFAPYVLL